MSTLETLYSLRFVYTALVAVSTLPVCLLSLMAFYAFQEADQLGIYTVSSNILSFSGVTILPFVTLFMLTIFLWQMRAYEIDDVNIKFD